MLTTEQEALLTATIEHYNEVIRGKTLREMVPDELTLALVNGMVVQTLKRNGVQMVEGLGDVLAECVGLGIWLAETGKTRLLERGGLQ